MRKTGESQGTMGISQKAIVLNNEGKMLTLFRTETAPTRPSTWDLPGGDLDFGEDAIQGITREIKEETGLTIGKVTPFDVEAVINPQGDYWVTIAYFGSADKQQVQLSSEHSDYRWVTSSEFQKINTSRRAQRFVENYRRLPRAPKLK